MAEEILARNSLYTDNKGNEPRDKRGKRAGEGGTENFLFLPFLPSPSHSAGKISILLSDRNPFHTVQIFTFDKMFHWWVLEALEK